VNAELLHGGYVGEAFSRAETRSSSCRPRTSQFSPETKCLRSDFSAPSKLFGAGLRPAETANRRSQARFCLGAPRSPSCIGNRRRRFGLGGPVWRKPICRGVITGVVCAWLAWAVYLTPTLRSLDDWALDNCFLLRGGRTSGTKLLIVRVDDAALTRLGKPLMFCSPELAATIRFLHAQGVCGGGSRSSPS